MSIGTSFPHRSSHLHGRVKYFRILALSLGIAFGGVQAVAQQAKTAPTQSRQSSEVSLPFAEAEALLPQLVAVEAFGSTALAHNEVTRDLSGASAPLVAGDSLFVP